MTNVFVAPKIRVGFQKRSDTFTGQLAYIIYYDEKGKLRKETSWQSWRDKKIEPQEFENLPTEGFTLNKDIKRYGGDWRGSGRTMIRIHDPRGFEFEVTTENLIGILMHTDCLRRGLIGQFVYAWVGPELVLLPTNSEEYAQAAKYTSGLAKKVSAKALVPGISYKTKRSGNTTFIGKFNWYNYTSSKRYYTPTGTRQESKVFVFTEDDGKTFVKKTSADFLSEPNNDTPVANLAELIDAFNKQAYAHKITKFEFRPTTFDARLVKRRYNDTYTLKRPSYFVAQEEGLFGTQNVTAEIPYGAKSVDEVKGYCLKSAYYDDCYRVNLNGEISKKETEGSRDRYYHNSRNDALPLAKMQEQKFFDLVITLDNGKEKTIWSIDQLGSEEMSGRFDDY